MAPKRRWRASVPEVPGSMVPFRLFLGSMVPGSSFLLGSFRVPVVPKTEDGRLIPGATARIDRSMDVAIAKEGESLQKGLPVLATVGSTAPFIGLFGTVWGIMNAFIEIAEQQNTNLAVVAPGIAEALLATGLGLLAAIPAVIFYNKLSADSDRIIGGYEAFADEFATIFSRQMDS